MKELMNQALSKYTTVRLGGTARTVLIPESTEELIHIINTKHPQYFIGGGSNLLIADREFDLVIDLRTFNSGFESQGNGVFRVGASLRLQALINRINEEGYGGIEYLYSVPGLVGGAVTMNAGRGKQYHQTISDFILSVQAIQNGAPVTINKEDCHFSHRNSIFKSAGFIVTGCVFQFPPMSAEESASRKKERLELCKKVQDASKPNFGSVFSQCNPHIIQYARKHQWGGKVHFSGKTANWIINEGGTFDEAMSAIKRVELMHKLLFQKCTKEVIIWE